MLSAGWESNQHLGLLTQKWDRIKLTPRYHCSSGSSFRPLCTLPFKPFQTEFPNSIIPFYPPHFKSPPLSVAIMCLGDTWPKSAAPRASQSDVSLFLHGETFSVSNDKTHVCGQQEPSLLRRASQRKTRRRGEGKASISPFPGMAWDSTQPGRHKAVISHPSSPCHCCCGGFLPNVCKSKNICFAL